MTGTGTNMVVWRHQNGLLSWRSRNSIWVSKRLEDCVMRTLAAPNTVVPVWSASERTIRTSKVQLTELGACRTAVLSASG